MGRKESDHLAARLSTECSRHTIDSPGFPRQLKKERSSRLVESDVTQRTDWVRERSCLFSLENAKCRGRFSWVVLSHADLTRSS